MKYFLGVDQHKKYSQVVVMDANKEIHLRSKVANESTPFMQIKERFGPDCQSVLEAGYNWGNIYDILEDIGLNPVLGNPIKIRAIADAQIKTDTIDAQTLAELLRLDAIPKVYVPEKDIRFQKNILRQRFWLVKIKTMTKNRIHQILDRNHIINPGYSDLFGKNGRKFINGLTLPEPDHGILKQHLALLDSLKQQVKETELWIDQYLADNPYRRILETIPGLGKILSALIALEIADINRFYKAKKFSSYCGLVPTTYASGGKIFHGNLVSGCNRWLRYAFIEAAWKSMMASPYFRTCYAQMRRRKNANTAIVILARKLSEIAYTCVKENRAYEERICESAYNH